MENTVIYFTLLLILYAILCFYLGFIAKGILYTYSQYAFFVLVLFLIPFLLFVLWNQSKAQERLCNIGVIPHPSIKHAVGMSTGTGIDPVWLFEVTASTDEIVDFYHRKSNVPDWELISKGSLVLVYKRGTKKLMIIAGENWRKREVVFAVRDANENNRMGR
jgi:Ca2+/Na+ antiporter